jgi:Phage integrase family
VRSSRIRSNPARGLGLPRPKRRDYVYLTHGQVLALAADAGRDRLLILLLAYTGLRWGEATALRVCDIDLDRQSRPVRAQVPQSRTVPLPRFLAAEVTAATAGKHGDQLVFTTPSGSVMRLPNWRRSAFIPARHRVGISDRFRVHDLRHTAALLMIQSGVPAQRCSRRSWAMPASRRRWTYTGIYIRGNGPLRRPARRCGQMPKRARIRAGKMTRTSASACEDVSALGGTRTPNLLIRSQMLYPLSYERWCLVSLRHSSGHCASPPDPGAGMRCHLHSGGWRALRPGAAAARSPTRSFLYCPAKELSLSVTEMPRKYANEAQPPSRCAMHLMINRRFGFISAGWCALLRQVSRWYVRPEGGDSG